MLFDGDMFRIVEDATPRVTSGFEKSARHYLEDPETLADFVRLYFKAFKFAEKGLDRHDAQDFFIGSRYRIGLIEFASTPFFFASRLY